MGSTSAAASSGVNWSAVLSRATSAYAVVASAEIWRAPSGVNGLVTLTTCRASATSARIASTRSSISGEVTPSSAWTTTWIVSPDRCGKRSCSVFETCCDSDPGWR